MMALLATVSPLVLSVDVVMLPMRASAVLLPGQRRRFKLRDERMKSLFREAEASGGMIGQFLQLDSGGLLDTAVPILKVANVRNGVAELTCASVLSFHRPLCRCPPC